MAVRFTEDEVLDFASAKRQQATSAREFEGICTDSRALSRGCLFVALEGERFDGHVFVAQAAQGGAAGAVVREGKSLGGALPAGFGVYVVADTLKALGGLARGHRRRFRIPVGAVGGSNGKTTTKEMVGAILSTRGPALKTEGNFNNEVGVPLTLFRLELSHVAAVVEMGMNHPGEMARLTAIAEPDAGLITVVQPEHLEGLGSLEGVAAAEGELFRGLSPTATAVVNLDDPLIVGESKKTPGRVLTFGRTAGADVRLVRAESRGLEGLTLTLSHADRSHVVRLAFLGEHNAQNAAAAFALGLALGYSPEECVRGLEAARPYQRRLNVIPAKGGVTVVDDCYNANPASMEAALKTVQGLAKERGGRAVAVLGDMLELGAGELSEHAALGALATGHAGVLAFFGPRSQQGFQAAQAQAAKGQGAQVAHFLEIEPLVSWLSPLLRAGDVVLVKGSRGMRLERAVESLTGAKGPDGH
jgi:UDP-N-acetylmuramoyl-tripeptide--D-alanyl-D-alanine ligase